MHSINEDGQQQTYEWDGLRRRRTNTMGSRSRPATSATSPPPVPPLPTPSPGTIRSPHPPLGMSRFPDDWEESDHENDDRSTIFSSIAGTIIRGRHRSKTAGTLPTYNEEEYQSDKAIRSPMRPVPLTDINLHTSKPQADDETAAYYGTTRDHFLQHPDNSYRGASSAGQSHRSASSLKPPTPPPHSARRQFSFNKVFHRRSQVPTEEERAGLVLEDDCGKNSDEESPDRSRTGPGGSADRQAFL